MKNDGSGLNEEIDFIEELRLRRWARENYLPYERRNDNLHPIILDEMVRKDREATANSNALSA